MKKFNITYHTLNEGVQKKCPCLRSLSIDQREIVLRGELSKSKLIGKNTELWKKIMCRSNGGKRIHLRTDNMFLFFVEEKQGDYSVISIDLMGNYEKGFKLGTYLADKGQEMGLA